MRTLARRALPVTAIGVLWAMGCGSPELEQHEPPPMEDLQVAQQAWVSCEQWTDTGYVDGAAFTITLVTVDDRPVEIDTANAYILMQEAAAAGGVEIRVVSGFRTWAEQDYFYDCYQCCCCNSCNQAAPPGYSNHQSGHALDLNTASAGVLTWLNNHGADYGFSRTVPSENWHWEWWGGGPGGGPCDATAGGTACTVTETGETGECMDTSTCESLGGDHVSTPGYCPGPSNIQCCTGTTLCTVTETGESGECLSTTACEALGDGYVAHAGYCPGPSYYQCCTPPAEPIEEDAGVPDDAGLPDDASVPDDAGLSDDAGMDGGGGPNPNYDPGNDGVPGDGASCDCRVARAPASRAKAGWLLAALLSVVSVRRRRRGAESHLRTDAYDVVQQTV